MDSSSPSRPNQKKMAEAINISRSYLSEIINDKKPVSTPLAKKIETLTGEPWHSYVDWAKKGSQIEAEIIAALRNRAA